MAKKINADTVRNGHDRDTLNRLAHENPWRLFNGTEIRIIFDIGESAMTRLRKLASKDRVTDPWINDKTRPEKFHDWLWNKRIELETNNPNI